MPLNNSQYDEIFRSYDAKQLKAQHQLEERTKAAYERSPELKALDASIAEISVASARRLLDGDSSALSELKAELKNLRARKEVLMKELSLPENYFEPVYECPDCKDTGYIGGKPCHCFKQQAIDLIYTQSNIKDILTKREFQYVVSGLLFRFQRQSRNRTYIPCHCQSCSCQMPRICRSV